MPVCNEADVIEDVIDEWVCDVFQYLPEGSEFLIDEAASKDGTREILQRLCEKHPFMKVESREVKDGFAAATRRLYARELPAGVLHGLGRAIRRRGFLEAGETH